MQVNQTFYYDSEYPSSKIKEYFDRGLGLQVVVYDKKERLYIIVGCNQGRHSHLSTHTSDPIRAMETKWDVRVC